MYVNDLLRIIAKSPRRRSARLAGWSGSWPFLPSIADGWTPRDVAALLADRVPLEGWADLAQDLVHRLRAADA